MEDSLSFNVAEMRDSKLVRLNISFTNDYPV